MRKACPWLQKGTACLMVIALFFPASCARRGLEPLSYDPPGSTITTDRPVDPQPRRTIGFSDSQVWVSNEFEGARLNDFYRLDDSTYAALILPENAPINNSAWYAFKIWSTRRQRIYVRLLYRHGTHRYYPKTSHDGRTWTRLDSLYFRADTASGLAELQLQIGPDTLWVAAQEIITSSRFEDYLQQLELRDFVTRRQVGRSKLGRPITLLAISETDEPRGRVFIISRQHPPEVTGTLALFQFLETLCEDSPLARRFRKLVAVDVIPLMNPDGVDLGHWRHNAGGVDLNRDWFQFNQPETRLARDVFMQLAEQQRVLFCLDFHSTQQDVFYTLSADLPTTPPQLSARWLNRLQELLPDYVVNEEPSGLGSPVSKNWFYQTFGSPAVTYEVGDENPRPRIRQVAGAAARALMQVILETL